MKDLYPNQKEFDTVKDCENAINDAMSVRALNQLREAVIKFKNPVLHKFWQEKYWTFKK